MERPEERKTMVFITHSIDEAIILGDLIAVMRARPGRIKEIIDLPFGRPRDVEAIRADPRYARIRDQSGTNCSSGNHEGGPRVSIAANRRGAPGRRHRSDGRRRRPQGARGRRRSATDC